MLKVFFKIFNYLIFLSLGFVLLWWVTKDQDINKLINEFKNANYYWIGLSLVTSLISHYYRAKRWNILLNSLGYKTKTSTTFFSVMIGYFANMAVPRLGEITRCGVLKKQYKVSINLLFGTVVSERIFDMICLIIIIFLTIIFQISFLKYFIYNTIINPLEIKIFNHSYKIVLIFILFISTIILFVIIFRKTWKKIKKFSFYFKLMRIISSFLSGIKTIKNIEHKTKFVFYTIMIWFMYFLSLYLCFFALKETSHLTLADAFTLMALGSLGIVAPVPAGIGTYHFIVITTLVQLYHVSSASATTFAYIVNTSQILIVFFGGIVSIITLFIINKYYKNETSRNN